MKTKITALLIVLTILIPASASYAQEQSSIAQGIPSPPTTTVEPQKLDMFYIGKFASSGNKVKFEIEGAETLKVKNYTYAYDRSQGGGQRDFEVTITPDGRGFQIVEPTFKI